MSTRTLVFILALAGCLAACREAEPPAAPPPPASEAAPASGAADRIEPDGLLQRIATLSSDEFGGRAPMSEGERLTLNYLETQFRELGLEPMFGDSYRQSVPLVALEADPDLPLEIQGPGVQFTYAYGPEVMLGTPRVVEQTGLEGSELVWVGYGIVAPEYGWNDYRDVDVSGKTVIVLVNDPGFATQDPELFNGNAMTYYGRWTYKFEEATRQGAAGALVVHETDAAAYGWNVVEDSGKGPQFYLATEDGNAERMAVEGWIQHHVAGEILAAAGHDLAALEAAAAQGPVTPVPLGLKASARIRNSIQFAESFNVGAIRPGTARPEELFIYMAHWDHLGKAPAGGGIDGDVIFNGAEDNASGTSGLLEIAEAFAAAPDPQRTVGFLAVTAEESGLLGSKAYVAQPAFPMQRTVAGINMDRLNFRGKMSDVVVIGHGASEMEDILAAVAREKGRTVTPEATPEKGYYYRSDHFNFAKRGVPILYSRGGTVDREHGAEYVAQRNADYTANRYHSVKDEIQADWDLEAAVEDLQLYFTIGWRLANSDTWPQWYAGNEFRAIREASLAETGQ
ncbi:M28 family metallopeptidase [Hydrogenophaga sp.]|uniref:M28 family metallopeptidase n=1 Tax=Hydrogenophaga sp. TaxID=1904254 RepID=UPI0025BCD767|nr:M28 family metallopeptidase [Hydrogenophaga sp.]